MREGLFPEHERVMVPVEGELPMARKSVSPKLLLLKMMLVTCTQVRPLPLAETVTLPALPWGPM